LAYCPCGRRLEGTTVRHPAGFAHPQEFLRCPACDFSIPVKPVSRSRERHRAYERIMKEVRQRAAVVKTLKTIEASAEGSGSAHARAAEYRLLY